MALPPPSRPTILPKNRRSWWSTDHSFLMMKHAMFKCLWINTSVPHPITQLRGTSPHMILQPYQLPLYGMIYVPLYYHEQATDSSIPHLPPTQYPSDTTFCYSSRTLASNVHTTYYCYCYSTHTIRWIWTANGHNWIPTDTRLFDGGYTTSINSSPSLICLHFATLLTAK